MDLSLDMNGPMRKPAGAAEMRMRPVVAAVLFSLLFHVSTGWYLLKVAKETKTQPIRRPLEFHIVKPLQPTVAPPAPVPQQVIPPKPLPRMPRPTPKIASQPKPMQSLPPTPAPAIETPKPIETPSVLPEAPSPEPVIPVIAEGLQTAPTVNSFPMETSSLAGPGSSAGSGVGGEVTEASAGSAIGADFVPPIFDAAYLSNPTPPYPSEARKLRLQGTTILRVLVNPEGKAEVIQIEKSSGTAILDGAALKAVKKWLFVPARTGNKAVSAWVDVPIRFRLN